MIIALDSAGLFVLHSLLASYVDWFRLRSMIFPKFHIFEFTFDGAGLGVPRLTSIAPISIKVCWIQVC